MGDPRLDANGQPVLALNNDGELVVQRESAAVTEGGSRASRLVERIFEQPLRAGVSSDTLRSFCKQTATGPQCFNGATFHNHAAYLNASERRVITEWVDLGAQYFNDAYDAFQLGRKGADDNAPLYTADNLFKILVHFGFRE